MHINPQFNHNPSYYHEYKVIFKLTSHISTFHQSSSINSKVCLFSHSYQKPSYMFTYISLSLLHSITMSNITVVQA